MEEFAKEFGFKITEQGAEIPNQTSTDYILNGLDNGISRRRFNINNRSTRN